MISIEPFNWHRLGSYRCNVNGTKRDYDSSMLSLLESDIRKLVTLLDIR